MGLVHVIRHAQASFGAADYDRLSDLGHRQSQALGRSLAAQGLRPVRLVIGAQRRHRETLEGLAPALGLDPAKAEVDPGLNEFDFKALLEARGRTHPLPEHVHEDRKAHFRTLRETVLAWSRDEIEDPPESYGAFTARVAKAMSALLATDGDALAVSSGGAISQMVASSLRSPPDIQIALQLQLKNCAVSRFVATRTGAVMHGFNETPHVSAETADMLTYS